MIPSGDPVGGIGSTGPRPTEAPRPIETRLEFFWIQDGRPGDRRDALGSARPASAAPIADTDDDGAPGLTLRPDLPPFDFAGEPRSARLTGAGELTIFADGSAGLARLVFEVWAGDPGVGRLIATVPATVSLDSQTGNWQTIVLPFGFAPQDLNGERISPRLRLESAPPGGIRLAYDRVGQPAGLALIARDRP